MDKKSNFVAEGVYTYLDHYSPFIYDVISNLKCYKPVIFSYGVGVHPVYYQFPVYAPNAINTILTPSTRPPIKKIARITKNILSRVGLYGYVFNNLLTRGDIAFIKAAKETNTKLIHAHFGPTGVFFNSLRKKLGIPLIVSTYGYDVSSYPKTNPKYLKELQNLFYDVSAILAMSHDMRSDLISLGCPTNKIIVHHLGVNTDDFKPSPKVDKPKLRILTVCNYVEKKGLPDLVKAFSLTIKRFPNVELRIIGRPDQENAITREVDNLIEKFGLSQYIQQIGKIPFSDLPLEFSQSDLYALPSVTTTSGEKEGIPTVLLEAQSTGLPVVSNWHAGIPEAVIDGKTGLLSKEHDVNGLASNITKILESTDLRIKLGKQGRDYIKNEFDVRIQSKKLEEIYDTVSKENN